MFMYDMTCNACGWAVALHQANRPKFFPY